MIGCITLLGLFATMPAARGFLVPSVARIPAVNSQPGVRVGHGASCRASFTPVGAGRSSRQQTASQSLAMVDEGRNLGKTIAAVLVLVATVVGSAVPFMAMGPDQTAGPKTIRVVDEEGNVSERGSMTAMTRAEIQKKLAQIPVFFLKDPSGGVHVDGGEGLLFMNPEDAQAKLASMGDVADVKVSATTLDDVWYPLIKKKGQNKRPVAAQAAVSSDLSARYRIVPRASQADQASETEGWNSVRDKAGGPVWAATSLGFEGPGGKTKTPLFTNMDDLMTSWERLKTEAGSKSEAPVVQVSSVAEIVNIMETGGGNSRSLEFFADMDSIEQAEKLL